MFYGSLDAMKCSHAENENAKSVNGESFSFVCVCVVYMCFFAFFLCILRLLTHFHSVHRKNIVLNYLYMNNI